MHNQPSGFIQAAGAALTNDDRDARLGARRGGGREGGEVAIAPVQYAPNSGAATSGPGLVIPGESFSKDFPASGERQQLVSKGGKTWTVSHPLPHPDAPGYAAITDWLNCTFPFKVDDIALGAFFDRLARVVPALRHVSEREGKGLNGYKRSFTLGADGAMFGCVGQHDTALLMLPGAACHTVPDWSALVQLLHGHYAARITRWDGAVDDYDGVHSVNWAVAHYLENGFTNGGNRPSCDQAGNWIEPDGSGRTFYVGKRKNGKMIRVYEKGMQLGQPFHPWVRWEVELHNVDRVIPWDVLAHPGKYVAGSYPKVMCWIQEEMSRIRTVRHQTEISYEHLINCASTAYGRLLNVMLEIEQSPEKVLERLRKDGIPKRLNAPIIPDGVK